MQHRTHSPLLWLTLLTACSLPIPSALAAHPAPDDDKNYRAGIGLLNKGLSDLAATELRSYLRDNPTGAHATSARYALAVCLSRQNQHAQAAAELQPVLALKDFEFAADALLLNAQCATATGDDQTATASLTRLLADFPAFAQRDRAALLLGESHYRRSDFKAALEVLSSITTSDRAGLFAAMSELNLRDFAAAARRAADLRAKSPTGEYAVNLTLIEAQCRRELADLPAAAALYTTAAAAATGPARAQALLGLAQVARAQRDWARATQALTDAAATKPPADLAERIYLERAKLLFDSGKPAPALKLLAQLPTKSPAAAETAYWSAKCESKLGKFQEAADRLTRAAAEHPTSDLLPDILFDRASALASAGSDDQALTAWSQWREKFAASDLAPSLAPAALTASALTAQAWCAHRLGKFDQSLELCAELAATKNADSESIALLIAENHFAAGHFEPALTAYTDLLTRYPQTTHASRSTLRRTLCLLKLDRAADAAQLLETTLASNTAADPALKRAAILTLAEALFAKQDWPQSEKWFALLAADAPTGENSIDALLRQAIAVERQGRFAQALPLLERLLTIAPDAPQALQARFELGQSLVELGRLDEAAAALQQVIAAENPPATLTPHALRHLATIASRQGRPADAATLLARLQSSADPASASSAATLADLAAALLAAGEFTRAEKTLQDLLATNPKPPVSTQARCHLAIALNRQGRAADALKELDAAGDLQSLDPEPRAAALYERALVLRALNRDAESVTALQALLAEPPSRLEAYAALDLAQAESKSGHHDQALALLTRALAAADKLDAPAAAPLRERATYLRAAALVQLSKPAEAADALKDFAKTYPASPLLAPAAILRAEALLAAGDPKSAVTELTRAITAAQTPELRSAANLRLGEAAAAAQNWPASEKAYASFLDSFPTSDLWFQARFGRGWALENQARYDAAIESYREVVARHKGPTAARAQFQIGECLYAQKNYEAAALELLKTDVLFDYPEWTAAALFEAGRCFAQIGRHDDAAAQFTDVTTRFPQTRWAQMAQERLSAKKPASLPGRASASAPAER